MSKITLDELDTFTSGREKKLKELLKEFVDWVEEAYDTNISDSDQDTTPAAVWRFLTTGELD